MAHEDETVQPADEGPVERRVMQHTPGPWVTERDRDPPSRPEIATVAWVADWCVGIPTPGYPGGNYRDAEYGTNEADARLIAAAPDLLAALQGLLSAVQRSVCEGSGPAQEAAHAAIHKALDRAA